MLIFCLVFLLLSVRFLRGGTKISLRDDWLLPECTRPSSTSLLVEPVYQLSDLVKVHPLST